MQQYSDTDKKDPEGVPGRDRWVEKCEESKAGLTLIAKDFWKRIRDFYCTPYPFHMV